LINPAEATREAVHFFATLAGELARRGYAVVAVLPEGDDGWLPRDLMPSHVVVERLPLESAVSPAGVSGLADLLRRHRIALTHSHDYSVATWGAIASRLAGASHVMTITDSDSCVTTMGRRLTMRAAVALSECVATPSAELRDTLREELSLPAEKLLVVPRGIVPTVNRSTDIRADLGLQRGDELVVAAGGLLPVNAHHVIVDAIARLSVRHPRVHLAIAGRGQLSAALRDQTHHLGLTGRVHFVGVQPDIAGLLQAADVFCHSSVADEPPASLLEAMFAATPIVATNGRRVAATLAGGQGGLLVPPQDVASLACALDRLLTDRLLAHRLGAFAAWRALSEYHASIMTDRYVALYDRALNHGDALRAA
jgi:glycosyltransferase involved in cell wall biosynthesis